MRDRSQNRHTDADQDETFQQKENRELAESYLRRMDAAWDDPVALSVVDDADDE